MGEPSAVLVRRSVPMAQQQPMKRLRASAPHNYALALFLLICLTTSTQALANGRPPGTTGLASAAGASADPLGQTLLLGLTFGLGVSHDSGKTFRWVCEEAIGGPTGVDALLAAPSANTLVTGSSKGLYISRDGGCDWQPVPLFAPPVQVSALITDPAQPNRWYVAVNAPEKNRGMLYVTNDSGKTFKKLPISQDGVYLYSVAVAAQDSKRIAVAGSNNAAIDSCLLFTSHNGGASWQKTIVKGAPPASATPTVAIAADDANAVIITALDITTNGSIALRSDDFGANFRSLGRIAEPVRNIVFAQGGKNAFIATTGHVLRTDGDTLATLPAPKSNACITRVNDSLYICGSSADKQDGFALAQSGPSGEGLTPLLKLTDIQAPQCPAQTSSQKMCAALWANQATAIKAAAHADIAAEFIPSEQTASAAASALAPTPNTTSPKAQGCRCDVGGAHSGMEMLWLAAPAIAYRLRRRRRQP